jgi:DNA-binding beta-propeller fold protein YncE
MICSSSLLHCADEPFSILDALKERNNHSTPSSLSSQPSTTECPVVLNPAGDLLILNRPMGLAFNLTGELYVADLLNKRVRKFPQGQQFPSSEKIESKFLLPWSLALDRKSNIYVTDTGRNQIIAIPPSGKPKNIGTKGQRPGTFNIPTGICVDEQRQRLLIADFANHVVQMLAFDGTFLGHIGGTTSGGLFGKAGRLEGEFRGPADVAVDSYGKIYVADKENSRIQIFQAAGRFIVTFGQAGAARGRFNRPSGLCLDHHGNIYVCDTFNNRVQIIKAPFATAMEPQFDVIKVLSTDKYPHLGPMKLPNKCAISNDGSLYVADTGNNRIIRFPPSMLE